MLNRSLGVFTALVGLGFLAVSVTMFFDHGQQFDPEEASIVVVTSVVGFSLLLFIYRIWPIPSESEESKIKKEISLLELQVKRKKLRDELESEG